MKKLFGTDGVRGKANIYPMTADIALKLGMAIGSLFKDSNKRSTVLIGKDTRISGYVFEYAITAGITAMGVDVLLVGPMPTPAIAHLTKSFVADAGIVISASHNPAEDNGIKFFDSNGFKLSSNIENEIEKLTLNNIFDTSDITGEKIGRAKRIDDAAGRYIEFAKGTINNLSLSGLNIVLDCANGAAYKIAPLIFKELGAGVKILNNTPDGLNINKNAGSLHPKLIANEIIKSGFDVGIALDGDADRVILIDETGEIIDGDEIIAIWANYKHEKNALKNQNIVTTVMSNLGFEHSMKKLGLNLFRTDVGDKHVSQTMREVGALVGGEQSGHLIFSKYSTTGDGIIAALQILRIMKKTNKKLSELKSVIKKYPQILKNIKVKEKRSLDSMSNVTDKILEHKKILGDEGRILVRYSGTENKVRVMVEGKNDLLINNAVNQISEEIIKEVGE